MRLYLAILDVLLSIACVTLCTVTNAGESGAISSPLVVLTGNDSGVSAESFRRITTTEEWHKTWPEHWDRQSHASQRAEMEIDFERCLVVAVFRGETWNMSGFEVDSVSESKEKILVRFIDIGYQTAGPDGGGDRVTPYAFIVLPKSDKPIVLEETIRTMIPGQALVWKEVARLDAGRK